MQGYPGVDDPCLDKYLNGVTQTDKGVYASGGLAVGVAIRSSAADAADPDLWVVSIPCVFLRFRFLVPGHMYIAT